MNATLEVAGELLTASLDDRLLTYRLLPYTHGNTSAGRVLASEGCLTLPDDPAALVLNDRHIADRRLAQGVSMSWGPDALVASFRVDEGPAGDALLDEANRARQGASQSIELRRGVSVEVKAPVIRAGRLLGGLLAAAAAVVRPAFPEATLLAADAGDMPDWLAPSESTSESTEEVIVDGVTYLRTSTSHYKTTVAIKGDGDADATAPAEDPDTGETVTASLSTTPGTVPAGTLLTASAPNGPVPPNAGKTIEPKTARDAARLLAAFHQTRDRAYLEPFQADADLFAALSDIKWDGTGGLSQTITQGQWLGNVWNNKTYQRRIIPLIQHDDLTSLTLGGWKWGTPPVMAPWTGNKSAVPSGTVTATPVTGAATRYAGAHDIAREFRDFSNEDFWKAYFEAMTESYAKVSDAAAGVALVNGATDVVPGTVPAGIPDALAYIVDGALSMLDIATPTFALVAPDLWRELILTPVDGALEFLSTALGLEDGTLGTFRMVPYSGLEDGSVLVGAKDAATEYELPGSPIRVEAENIANGGVDEGMFGYAGTVINEPLALALVAPAEGA